LREDYQNSFDSQYNQFNEENSGMDMFTGTVDYMIVEKALKEKEEAETLDKIFNDDVNIMNEGDIKEYDMNEDSEGEIGLINGKSFK